MNFSQPGCPGMLNCVMYLNRQKNMQSIYVYNRYSTIISKYNLLKFEARNLTGIVDQKGIKQTTVLLRVI